MKLFVLLIGLLVVACANNTAPISQNTSSEMESAYSSRLLTQNFKITTTPAVVDSNNMPIADATVMIGYEAQNPFMQNILTTNENGMFAIPNEWVDALPVTISAPGFMTTTFMNEKPGRAKFVILPEQSAVRTQISGQTTGFGNLPKDGFADFGYVIPYFDRASLNTFTLSDVLSPDMDSMSVWGKTMVMPSNFTFPDQKEKYGIITVRLNKPTFRYNTFGENIRPFLAGRGKFPFEKVAGDLQDGKSFFDVLNDMEFLSAGKTNIDLSLSSGHTLDVSPFVFQPSHSTSVGFIPQNMQLISVMMNAKDGGFIPSDIKSLTSGKTQTLKGLPGHPQFVLGVMGQVNMTKSKSISLSEQRTLHFSEARPAHKMEFLELITAPHWSSAHGLRVQLPPTKNKIAAHGMYITLSKVVRTMVAGETRDLETRLWEIYSQKWETQPLLPNLIVGALNPNEFYRLRVQVLGREGASVGDITGVDLITTSSHATQNSIDLR